MESNGQEEEPQDQNQINTNLTGKEIDLGQVPFNLAQYAKEESVTEKLYLTEAKDIYIEINVKSKLVDG